MKKTLANDAEDDAKSVKMRARLAKVIVAKSSCSKSARQAAFTFKGLAQ